MSDIFTSPFTSPTLLNDDDEDMESEASTLDEDREPDYPEIMTTIELGSQEEQEELFRDIWPSIAELRVGPEIEIISAEDFSPDDSPALMAAVQIAKSGLLELSYYGRSADEKILRARYAATVLFYTIAQANWESMRRWSSFQSEFNHPDEADQHVSVEFAINTKACSVLIDFVVETISKLLIEESGRAYVWDEVFASTFWGSRRPQRGFHITGIVNGVHGHHQAAANGVNGVNGVYGTYNHGARAVNGVVGGQPYRRVVNGMNGANSHSDRVSNGMTLGLDPSWWDLHGLPSLYSNRLNGWEGLTVAEERRLMHDVASVLTPLSPYVAVDPYTGRSRVEFDC